MANAKAKDIEVDLLLEGIQRLYGYDFRGYARSSVIRRIEKHKMDIGLPTISDLQARILHDQTAMDRFVDAMSVNVTSMFRDAEFFQAFRRFAIPELRKFPSLRLWVAGCSTGEEVYSLAIILHEEGLLERARIYATDFSEANVEKAKTGRIPLKSMRDYTRNYFSCGGQKDFSSYYDTDLNYAELKKDLIRNISFSQHNLITDKSFNEFQVILCRNVMIYFERALQERAMHLLQRSLAPLGYLCLGSKESIVPASLNGRFDEMGSRTRLFRLKN